MIEAAGGVVWRRSSDGDLEVLVVHRPRYDDWSLPKGKLDDGETHVEAARREVLEETGLGCEPGTELPEVRYVDRKDRPKRVRYWEMPWPGGGFAPNDEADAAEWVPVTGARDVLSYPHDADVVELLPGLLADRDARG